MTEYVILRYRASSDGDPGGYDEIGRASARSARSAIRERLDGSQQSDAYYGDGVYVAVPARSWQEVTVKTETETRLKFS